MTIPIVQGDVDLPLFAGTGAFRNTTQVNKDSRRILQPVLNFSPVDRRPTQSFAAWCTISKMEATPQTGQVPWY
jgi:hypothetical protein